MYIIGLGAAVLTGESDVAAIMLKAGLGAAGLILFCWCLVRYGRKTFEPWNTRRTALDLFIYGVTGISYGFDEEEGLYNALVYAHENREALAAMQPACLKKAEDYLPENALAALFERIGD